MLPTIGIMVATTGGMVGFYILTRVVELDQKDLSKTTRVLASITGVVAVVGILVLAFLASDLLVSASSASSTLRDLSS